MDRDAIVDACVASEVPIGAVNAIDEIFEDPHFKERGNLFTVDDPVTGPVTVPGVAPRLSRTPGRIDNLGPALANANDAVYSGLLGLSADDIAALQEKGVI